MMCKQPWVPGNTQGKWFSDQIAFSCGNCLPCRINKQRIMKTRMVLESYSWPYSLMVTLTYDEYHLPGPSLVSKDLCNYIKRVRRHYEYHYDMPIRYFGCGEYGRENFRPHFHVAFFGDFEKEDIERKHWNVLRNKWSKKGLLKGRVQVGRLEKGGCGYLSHYLTKGLRNTDKRIAKMGLKPEFMRLSQGLGKQSALEFAERAISNPYWDKKPITEIIMEKKTYPLGRLLSKYVNERLGLEEEKTEKVYDELYDNYCEKGTAIEQIIDSDQKRLQQKKKFEIWTSEKRKI